MISPTGNGIRSHDEHGFGAYGKPRAGSDNHGVKKIHEGTDFIAIPGQDIVAPTRGFVMRLKYPYGSPVKGVMFSGIFVRSTDFEWTLFYFDPLRAIINTEIVRGQLIGKAQDISIKYSGITPHVHFQIDSINPELFIRMP